MDTVDNKTKWDIWMELPHQEIHEITMIVKHGFTRATFENIDTLKDLIDQGRAVAPEGLSIGAIVCMTLHGWNAVPGYPNHSDWEALTQGQQAIMLEVANMDFEDEVPGIESLKTMGYLIDNADDYGTYRYYLTYKGAGVIPPHLVKKG